MINQSYSPTYVLINKKHPQATVLHFDERGIIRKLRIRGSRNVTGTIHSIICEIWTIFCFGIRETNKVTNSTRYVPKLLKAEFYLIINHDSVLKRKSVEITSFSNTRHQRWGALLFASQSRWF